MKKAGKVVPLLMGTLVRKPCTVLYPFVKTPPQEHFRGKLKYNAEACIGCHICTRVCPAGAIEIEKAGEKRFKAFCYLDRCIYCGQCVDSCVKGALKSTKDFELANFDRKNLKVEI